MWIALGIILFLAVVVTVILLLPIDVIIKSDDDGSMMLRYRFLFKTYGEDPNPNNPVVKLIKTATGIDRLQLKKIKGGIKTGGINVTVEESFRVLLSLLKEVGALLKFCVAKKLRVTVISTGDDPADAAINHGICCSFVYPVVGFLKSELRRVSKRGEHIELRCDFDGTEDTFVYDIVIRVRLYRLLAAFFRIVLREARYQADQMEL